MLEQGEAQAEQAQEVQGLHLAPEEPPEQQAEQQAAGGQQEVH